MRSSSLVCPSRALTSVSETRSRLMASCSKGLSVQRSAAARRAAWSVQFDSSPVRWIRQGSSARCHTSWRVVCRNSPPLRVLATCPTTAENPGPRISSDLNRAPSQGHGRITAERLAASRPLRRYSGQERPRAHRTEGTAPRGPSLHPGRLPDRMTMAKFAVAGARCLPIVFAAKATGESCPKPRLTSTTTRPT